MKNQIGTTSQSGHDGITIHKFMEPLDATGLKNAVKEWHRSYDVTIPPRLPVYYCTKCKIVIVTPPWFEELCKNKLSIDPRKWLNRHIKCCDNPRIWYLIILKMDIDYLYPKSIDLVWRLGETFITSRVVLDEFV